MVELGSDTPLTVKWVVNLIEGRPLVDLEKLARFKWIDGLRNVEIAKTMGRSQNTINSAIRDLKLKKATNLNMGDKEKNLILSTIQKDFDTKNKFREQLTKDKSCHV